MPEPRVYRWTRGPIDESRHTGRRDPQNQPSAGTEAPSYHPMVDTPASGQGNLSAPRSSRGGLRNDPRESVDHRKSPPAALVEVGKPGPAQSPDLQDVCECYDCVLTKLREEVKHEYNRRHYLLVTLRRLHTDREKDRSDFALAQLENKRERRVLREELAVARRENMLLRYQHESLVRDHKNMLGILEYNGYLSFRKRPRTSSTGGVARHKT